MLDKNLVEVKGEPFIIDMMYARTDNMPAAAVYEEVGFGKKAYVHKDLWERMQKLIPVLQAKNLKMKICDAYRPPLAHKRLREIIPVPGFFSSIPKNSKHCHATAIDVVLCDVNGVELKFPTLVDAYDAQMSEEVLRGEMDNFNKHLQKARQDYQNPEMKEEIANREMLCQMMEDVGLAALNSEWWHYSIAEGDDEAIYPMIEF